MKKRRHKRKKNGLSFFSRYLRRFKKFSFKKIKYKNSFLKPNTLDNFGNYFYKIFLFNVLLKNILNNFDNSLKKKINLNKQILIIFCTNVFFKKYINLFWLNQNKFINISKKYKFEVNIKNVEIKILKKLELINSKTIIFKKIVNFKKIYYFFPKKTSLLIFFYIFKQIKNNLVNFKKFLIFFYMFLKYKKKEKFVLKKKFKKSEINLFKNNTTNITKKTTQYFFKNFANLDLIFSSINFKHNIGNYKTFFFSNLKLLLRDNTQILSDFFETKEIKKKYLNKFAKLNTPILEFLNPKIKMSIVNMYSSSKYYDVSKFAFNYIVNFFENFLLSKIVLSITSNDKEKKVFFKNRNLISISRSLYFYKNRIGKGLFLEEMIELLLISFIKKDITIFKNWFRIIMEKLHFKKHKKLLYLLKYMFLKFLWKYFIILGCLGFKLSVSGKIGVSGNSKTRTWILKWGAFSLTKKSIKLDYIQDVIRTNTGVLGFNFFLTY